MISKKILVIAEAGVNHNGDFNRANEMVRVAAASGADYVKFQAFKADNLVSNHAKTTAYQKNATGSVNQREMLSSLELSLGDFEKLAATCEKEKIGFLVTPFDYEIVSTLIEFGMDRIKVSSGDLTNISLLVKFASFDLPMIVSTGMANEKEVSHSIEILKSNNVDDITILQCTSLYPAPPRTINLRAMKTMRDKYKVNVGFSDHSIGTHISIAAAALGATTIEKHFTLDRSLPGPDHMASLEPVELSSLIAGVRDVQEALGNGVKEPVEDEIEVSRLVRRSWHTTRDIELGTRLSEKDIVLKRPGDGMLGDENPIGRILKNKKRADSPIYQSDLEVKS
ncbi:MAG: N-acetylneuraminate synthase [Alphaproteobacteria bacterium]|nr:N-acetylneuraminate synthase [Alphaproteobacteria bacterium]|tara:strand:- start:45 stop:1061 length:1017 start_codon:yes stop_codon:yes gene_type:complete